MHSLFSTSVILSILSATSFFNLAGAAALPQTKPVPSSSSSRQATNLLHGPDPNAAPQAGSAAFIAELENYDYSKVIENKGIPSDLWSIIDDQLDDIKDVPEDTAFEGCLLNEFGVYSRFDSINNWIVSEGGPEESQISNFRVYTARCIDWMNEFNAQGHTFEDWRMVYKYWII